MLVVHGRLQPSQLAGSVCVLVHTEPQSVAGGVVAGHWHAPDTHFVEAGHVLPHAPQLAVSVWVLVQAPLQFV